MDEPEPEADTKSQDEPEASSPRGSSADDDGSSNPDYLPGFWLEGEDWFMKLPSEDEDLYDELRASRFEDGIGWILKDKFRRIWGTTVGEDVSTGEQVLRSIWALHNAPHGP